MRYHFSRRRPTMPERIRIIPHEAIASKSVFLTAVRPRFFYWDDIAGRRLRADLVDGATARQAAQSLAKIEQAALDGDAN